MCEMSGMCDVTRYQGDTKGLLFSSVYVNIVLFLTQRSFVFKRLCKYCIVLLINFECMLKLVREMCVNKTIISYIFVLFAASEEEH